MPCFHQQLAVPMPGKTKNGKIPYKFIGKARNFYTRFNRVDGLRLMPCRQCIGCRLSKSAEWATRLMHETKFHSHACFLTLTYAPENIPVDHSLKKEHLRTFIKDLRARMDYYGKEKIKHFSVGEYADPNETTPTGRPHYHCALFGPISGNSSYNFSTPGYLPEEPARSGASQWSHPDINAVWPHGRAVFSELSFESAAYVARYQLKKVSGISAEIHYGSREREFQSCSNGLGKGHFEDWKRDIYPSDQVVFPGRGSFTPPQYYDRLLEKADPLLYQQVKKARQEAREEMTEEEFLLNVERKTREGKVRELVTEQTLVRGGIS